ncbi:MAG: MGMT family protein [Planctomycetota bacterium]|nr:MGMT family protein [Planctomycetota bacterium]
MPEHQLAERRYRISTAWGAFEAVFTERGLREFHLPAARFRQRTELKGQEGALGRQLRKALRARLEGRRVNLPWEAFDLGGRPVFYRKVWRSMHRIPFGEVRSYLDMARSAGSAQAVRAAGSACGANPIVLFLPCHRVVSASGPGGFGAGLKWKQKLLALEGYALKV